MRSVFFPRLINGPFGDPAFYVRLAHHREALLFDCGDLRRLGTRDALKITALFVSHAHIDHMVGFDALLRTFLYQDRTLLVYGPAGMADQIQGRLSGYTWNLIEGYPLALTVREWDEGPGREVTFRAANGFVPEGEGAWGWGGAEDLLLADDHLQVRALALDHGGIVSLAFSLAEPLHVAIHKDALERHGYLPGPWLARFKDLLRKGAAGTTPVQVPRTSGEAFTVPLADLAPRISHTERGMKIVYVTDAAPSRDNLEKIVTFANDAHLLAIEAVFPDAELARARERNHLTARLAGDSARRAGALRLLTFHHSPRYQDDPDRLPDEARAAFAPPLGES
ncbi:ribonuclease Z [Desulfuromonas sp. DDH964]|uniref:MBL fold metallo-hydrolase n=1 Tax=Desulfuromonas sp. DDH964 TaxID=1823759 RepID=UPI00078B33D6|nr:MBL fold metallo-hydrolase [Desulfuromonas sp. DDH964]AMV72156.1 ribonuclease Z [Desulfuromonas sp. DDH964]